MENKSTGILRFLCFGALGTLLLSIIVVVGMLTWMWFVFGMETEIDEIDLLDGFALSLIAVPTDEYNHGVKALLKKDGSTVIETQEVFYAQTEYYTKDFEWRYSSDRNKIGIFYPDKPDEILFVLTLSPPAILPNLRFERLSETDKLDFEPNAGNQITRPENSKKQLDD
ncbi:MAG: hypothetical protein ACSHYA_16350 [Opitutaceae bacterium]